ncbi:hypothetical protein, partial [Pseudomonas moorei]|uniref:hypothetical protein n=1 Tax=Pseudomonas moorei TaxID=395599 RepID=UPI00200EA6E8
AVMGRERLTVVPDSRGIALEACFATKKGNYPPAASREWHHWPITHLGAVSLISRHLFSSLCSEKIAC